MKQGTVLPAFRRDRACPEKYTRKAACEGDRNSDFVYALSYVVPQKDRTRKVIEWSAAGECPSSWHAQTERVSHCHDPCNVVRSLTLHYHMTILQEVLTQVAGPKLKIHRIQRVLRRP